MVVAPAGQSQLLRGVLDLCVLGELRAAPTWGYALLARLTADGVDVAAGSIYPALGRLKRAGFVTTEEQPGHDGPPRTSYRLTPAGHDHLAGLVDSWDQMAAAVHAVLARTTTTGSPT